MIYLNNAEKTLYKPTAESLSPVPLERVRALAARLLGVENPSDIFLTRGGDQAMKTALQAYVREGCHIVAVGPEREDTFELLKELGAEVSRVETDAYLRPKYEETEKLIRPETQAVICAHGCSATGNVTDLERVCAIAKKHEIPVISDGRCTAGAIDVNLEELGPDVYCFAGEGMLMGPVGVGGICVRNAKARERIASAAAGENTELEQKILTAFAASLQFILDKGIYGVTMLPHRLAKRFFESAKAMDSVSVWGDFGTKDRLPVVSVTADGFLPEEICAHMEKKGIIIGVERGMARFSFGYFNTRSEVKEAVLQLMDLLGIDDLYLLP